MATERSLTELLQAAQQMTTKTDASLPLSSLQTRPDGSKPYTSMEVVRDDLPRVDRSLAQLVKVGEALWPGRGSRGDTTTLPADQEAHASILLGSRGLDLPHMTCRLTALTASPHTATPHTAYPESASPGAVPWEAASLATYVRQQRQRAIVSALHVASCQTSEEVECRAAQQRQSEWELSKQSLLQAFVQDGDLLSLSLPLQEALTVSEGRPAVGEPGETACGGLSSDQLSYTRPLVDHNERALERSSSSGGAGLAQAMCDLAVTVDAHDQGVVEMWQVVAAMCAAGSDTCSSPGAGGAGGAGGVTPLSRDTPATTSALVAAATNFLEAKYKTHIKTMVYNNLARAGLKGVPGLAALVKAYIAVFVGGEVAPLLEDGVGGNGAPVWPLLYYCVRAGGMREAASAATENSCPAVVEVVACLQQASRSADQRVSAENEKRLRVSYRRSARAIRDPYKRALYCVLARCDVMEDHSDVATTTDDYLWLKLCMVETSSEGERVPPTPTVGGAGGAKQDVLTLAALQRLMYKQYGETHFNAYEQPLLYTNVLLLTAQFEAAVEFLRRSDRLLHHAVHVAVCCYTAGLLRLPASTAAPLLSRETEESDVLFLNLSRVVLLYTRRFETSHPREALHYFYLLRGLKTPRGEDVMLQCVRELALSSRLFDLLLGEQRDDGTTCTRSPGLLDHFKVDVDELTEAVAQDCEQRGLHEDAVRLYDLAKKHEKVISLLCKLLSQVVHLNQPTTTTTPTIPPTAGSGSDRERILELACTIGLRYRSQGHTASVQSAATLHLLLDLSTVFDLYHAQRYHDALEVVRRLQLIALDPDEVEARVAGLAAVSADVKTVIPPLLLAAITATHHLYSTTTSGASSTQHLRRQARAVVTFAGLIPLRLHAHINARLVQLKALIN